MSVNELFLLKGRVAVITGAGGLLGRVFADALSEAGADVILGDLNVQECERKARTIKDTRAVAMELDVTDPNSIEGMLSKIRHQFGRLDIFINGAYRHVSTPFEERTLEDFEAILKVNLTGVFLCCQAAAKMMREQGGGNIINIGSMYGVVSPDPRMYGDESSLRSPEVYAASKAGVIQLTRYLAVHLAAHNIRVNCLSPGGVFNDQTEEFSKSYNARVPLGRMAKPEDMKGALVFLASDASSYVTGHNLVVDGGFTIW